MDQQLAKLSEEADTLKKEGKYEEAVGLYSHAMTMLGKKGYIHDGKIAETKVVQSTNYKNETNLRERGV